ncbi:MAG: tRNA preQ1(34) S-adenosylmethionine ribosyltransferase-isomerase QueA [Denitrovibrio sp.]|nr:MAG: tRNA preQ1(34) S-adenosylmethionine ribosyltransferase-isomerase QueA [Denitrovibrio sp.]
MSEIKTPISDYDFHMPEELIAQFPAKKRGESKLLVTRPDGTLEDKEFSDINYIVAKNSFMVINTTKVMKARILGSKDTGGQVEILVLEKLTDNTCVAITKGKVKLGTVVNVGKHHAVVKEILEDSSRVVEFDITVSEAMELYGHMPLPPYIRRGDAESDAERYQTVYSKDDGSVAAPTAGLHFTPKILDKLKKKGIPILEISLSIGIGTFRPVKVDFLEDHEMHTEKYFISEEVAAEINKFKSEGKKLVAVGTTAVRALESATEDNGVKAGYGETNLFIKPGYKFKMVDELVTNFHLPKSTLFVLVSELAGRERMIEAYNHAKKNKYRFFSYGDAMYIK